VTPQRSQLRASSDRAEATRAALVRAARELFVTKGYFDTGTEEIVAAAGVGTRGALYHHFAGKRALFVAVFEAVQADLIAAADRFDRPGDALSRLRESLLGYLEASLTPEVQRILLLDGPAVLGRQDWREIGRGYGLGAMQRLLERAVADGSLPAQPLEALAHVLFAASNEAALFIAAAEDPPRARNEAVAALDLLLSGLRTGLTTDRA
jgi:AcrR family transcriptional regulator